MNIGERYWCIRGDLESEGYGQTYPRRPWLGVVTEVRGGWCRLSRVADGGKPDLDGNASAGCGSRDLYATEADADRAYLAEATAYLRELEGQRESWAAEVVRWRAKVGGQAK